MRFFMNYPGNKTKALTLSYDDGVIQDKRFVEIIDKYGLKATFNINSGLFSDEDVEKKGRMSLRQCVELYANSNHEVATHGHTHMAYDMASLPAATYEIAKDREELEKIFKRIIRGGAYPFGTYNDESIQALKSAGVVYCRTTKATHAFAIPKNWLELHPTCHHNDSRLFELTEDFVNSTPYYPRLFYVWGHTYEFDNDNNWDRIEKFCELAGGKDDIWYCTNMEVYEYVEAYKSLIFSMDSKTVYNPTLKKLWFECNDKYYSIESGETIVLK
ncbi:MAG: polysaccharide deacetylase family protein [Clostridia bacterium]|nr:polysaccharide deacetylase family protein [Clostridia bacterium]